MWPLVGSTAKDSETMVGFESDNSYLTKGEKCENEQILREWAFLIPDTAGNVFVCGSDSEDAGVSQHRVRYSH